MPLKQLALPALLPTVGVSLFLWALGHSATVTSAGALLTLAMGAAAVFLSRSHLARQLDQLTRTTRGRGEEEGAPPARHSHSTIEEIAALEASIDALQAHSHERSTQLRQQTRILEAVLDGMAEGIWVTDADGTVVRHNDALQEMLRPQGGLKGQRPLELLRHEGLNMAVMAACREGAQSRLELTLDGLLPRTLAIRVTPLGRDLPGSAAVFHDVTELRRLEKVRKDFVANVSHELRTPITAIRGYAETLQAGALQNPEIAPKMVDTIHRQSERLSELVEDLLELSRLESREVKLTRALVSVAEAARRALETVRFKANQRDIHIRLEVPEGLSALGDGRALEQVLLNLLDNAVKYTPTGGWVTLTALEEAHRCVVHVKDTGGGIEAKHLPRIFERFYRVDKGRSRDMGGTGLGLSIVKHLMGAMGGGVEVASSPSEGSTFTISLPAATQMPPAE